jgi:hypothetical protein
MTLKTMITVWCVMGVWLTVAPLRSHGSSPEEREAAYAETLHPFTGTSLPAVDTGSLTGKVMCGYQGWFNAEGDGANQFGCYAVMYDLSGMGPNQMSQVMDDWRQLRTRMRVTEDPAYLRHRSKPVVVVWGVGFNRDRAHTVAECGPLVEFLKQDGCTVMLGVPTGWRELNRDSVNDPVLYEVIKRADIVSPWTVGRYNTPAEAEHHGTHCWQPDITWCREHGLDYLPVAFPGFSWFNMKGEAFDKVPRLGGRFFWSQFVAAKKAGAEMLYVAMFDEVDEATASNNATGDK